MEFYSENVTTFTCAVGDKMRLCRPVGHKPALDPEGVAETTHLNGFRVVYPELGEFEGKDGDNCVFYRHKKSGRQVVEFLSVALGLRYFYLILEGIVVHDHASIPQGGPAYATYFSEPEGTNEEA